MIAAGDIMDGAGTADFRTADAAESGQTPTRECILGCDAGPGESGRSRILKID
jgi:hypothetical protein